MNFLLEITKGDYTDKIIETKGFTETLGFGLQMLALGMLAVFAVLCLIWFMLVLFEKAFAKGNKKVKVEKVAEATIPAPTPVSYGTDEEIVAVIAAAIAMAESEGSGIKFRVVSFRRK